MPRANRKTTLQPRPRVFAGVFPEEVRSFRDRRIHHRCAAGASEVTEGRDGADFRQTLEQQIVESRRLIDKADVHLDARAAVDRLLELAAAARARRFVILGDENPAAIGKLAPIRLSLRAGLAAATQAESVTRR